MKPRMVKKYQTQKTRPSISARKARVVELLYFGGLSARDAVSLFLADEAAGAGEQYSHGRSSSGIETSARESTERSGAGTSSG